MGAEKGRQQGLAGSRKRCDAQADRHQPDDCSDDFLEWRRGLEPSSPWSASCPVPGCALGPSSGRPPNAMKIVCVACAVGPMVTLVVPPEAWRFSGGAARLGRRGASGGMRVRTSWSPRSDGDGVSGAPRGRRGPAGWLDRARAAGPSHRRAGRARVLRAPVAGVDWAAVLLRLPQPRQRRQLGHRGRRPAALQLGRDQRRRPGAGPRRLGPGTGPAGAGRGGVGDRRRHAGQGAGHDPARPARRGRRPGRHRGARRRGPAPQPSDGQGVPRQRLPGQDPRRSRGGPGGGADVADPGGAGAVRAAGADGGRGGYARLPGTAVGGGGRRVPAAGHGRRRAVPQPARRRVQRPGVPGQPERAGGPVGGRLSLDRRGARPGRPGRDGRPRGRCRADGGGVRGCRGAGVGGALGRLRRDRSGGRRSARPSCSGSAARPACG